jgi:hypothetical protein
MSESTPTTAVSSPLSSIIVTIISNHVRAIEALTTASADSLDHATLRSSYKNAINLTHILHSSEKVTNWFATLATENEDLMLECDATIANRNVLTAQVMQPEAQLMQTHTLVTATTNSSPTTCKGQTDPKMFTGEDRSKLRSFVALLRLHLIDRPREFPNKQSKL